MTFLEHKIPPPLVAVIAAFFIWLTPGISDHAVLRFGLVAIFFILAAVFLLAGAGAFKKADTTVNPLKPATATSLVTSGIYRYTRNPMYVGFVLMLCAWSSFLASLWSVVFIVGYIVYIQRFQIVPEERYLNELFGQDYTDYCLRVRRWL
ncbi:hypothetical protein SIN8267_01419 [Sinobacterium norvegicum]|uniref:Protein-S-isoprenylcysteine methyltransferase n=1 Tax=Sinobacterium norvegicum TaxID=1641715 RepID=A0ABN8EMJ6_9GAMM|nr:isoprenylcysteine carboxylmethyltransferase family protein [Sinobacterium norvegicum]CAH0991316.1 hypothetical protein SIN8267_01419 [Sinobacterium norvegicum]